MAFLDMIGELTGVMPGLSPLLAQKYINRALVDVYNKRNWSFLVADGVVVCPTQIVTGSVSIVQYTNTVTLDAAASAAIASQIGASAVPGITNMQIRFGNAPTSGQVYSITAVDNTNPAAVILTLDRVVVEATNAANAFQIYRCLLVPPLVDFKRWESLVDVANAISITSDRLRMTSAQLDRRDPQRAAQGLAYFVASWGGNRIGDVVTGATVPNANQNASTPIYELWPHPTSGQTFYVRLRRYGAQLVNMTDELPEQIPETLVLAKALGSYCYPFAKANVANFPTFKGADWTTLMIDSMRQYNQLLLDATRNDNEQELQDVWNRGHGLRHPRPYGRFGDVSFPIDSDFLQSHLIRF